MLLATVVVSREIVNVVVFVESAEARLIDRPAMASVTVLLGFVIAMPSSENFASAASATCVVCVVPALGSNATCDRPLASVLLLSASVVEMRKPFAAPVELLAMTRRFPVPSLMIDAVTPAPAL